MSYSEKATLNDEPTADIQTGDDPEPVTPLQARLSVQYAEIAEADTVPVCGSGALPRSFYR